MASETRTYLPPQRFIRLIDGLLDRFSARGDGAAVRLVELLRSECDSFGQVVAQRRVPAPVRAGNCAEPVQRQLVRSWLVFAAHDVIPQQLHGVNQVLGVDLDDLQYGQQQVGDA